MQNDQIRHGDTYGEGFNFRRSATPLHLHKCVAWFVSDSRVSCSEAARKKDVVSGKTLKLTEQNLRERY